MCTWQSALWAPHRTGEGHTHTHVHTRTHTHSLAAQRQAYPRATRQCQQLLRPVCVCVCVCMCVCRDNSLPAWDVLALIQRCCSQGAAVPPGQLEHLLEYTVSQTEHLQPSQLVDTLAAAAAVVARSLPAAAAAALPESTQQGNRTPRPGAAAAAAVPDQQGAVHGSSIYAVMEALRPGLNTLTGEQAARVASALTSLRGYGMAAALPLPVWLNAYCTATQPTLQSLSATQLKQVFTLLARSGHFPSATYLADAVEATRAVLATVKAPDTHPWAKFGAALVGAGGAAGGSALGEVLCVLELLVLDLGCEPSSQLAMDVASHLVPALSSQADTLTPTELCTALRLLAAMRCRPPAGAVQKLLGATERYLFQLPPGRLALVAWACAELGAVPRRAFLSRYAHTHTPAHTHIHTHLHTHIHTPAHTHIHARALIHTAPYNYNVSIHAWFCPQSVHVCAHGCNHVCVRACVCVCVITQVPRSRSRVPQRDALRVPGPARPLLRTARYRPRRLLAARVPGRGAAAAA